MPAELLDYNAELWHAPVGAYLAEKEAGITDPEISFLLSAGISHNHEK
jgi:HD superfamily phosphohydrolase YqeK